MLSLCSYKLPPRPSAGGWQCQQWPKENHIFAARVVIVALGSQCTIRLVDRENGSLFAQCPLDNDNPKLSVEPVIDSSRYFVIRVADGSGRYAYLGMGYRERNDAFEFNVTLQDHIKRLNNEKAAMEAATAPQAPPQDFSLKGSISIAVPGGSANAAPKTRAPAPAAGAAGLTALMPPPGGSAPSSRSRRPVAGSSGVATAALESNPFSGGFGDAAPFGEANAFAAPGGNPFGDANPFADATPFDATPFGDSTDFGGGGTSGATAPPAGTAGAAPPSSGFGASFGDGGGGDGEWVAFGK